MGNLEFDTDIVVVGGGLAGYAAAVSAAKCGLKIVHLAPKMPVDRRTSALMGPSVAILEEFGLIDEPAKLGTPLTQIRIIDGTGRLVRAPETLFDSAEAGHDAFGWNFANQALLSAFARAAEELDTYRAIETKFESLTRENSGFSLTTSDGEHITCRLVVGADGKASPIRNAAKISVREHKFAQSAFVCDLELERPLGGTSVEFHYANGPFTLVPAGDKRANLVWIDNHADLQVVQDGGEETITNALNAKSMHLFGQVKLASPTFIFPLSTLHAEQAGCEGIVLVGESAHAFPPIGAQGLNLGLRDVADLAASLKAADSAGSQWATEVSADYAQRRMGDLERTSSMVDTLFKSLLSDMLPQQALRAGGLWALRLSPNLRKRAFAAGMGVR